MNLRDRRLEVHRHPDREFGIWGHRSEHDEAATCRPLARPDTEIRVRDLLGMRPGE